MRLILLLVACFVFHAHFAGAAGVIPIVVLAVLTFASGLSRRRWVLYCAMIASVLALVLYKYSHIVALELLGRLQPTERSAGGRNGSRTGRSVRFATLTARIRGCASPAPSAP